MIIMLQHANDDRCSYGYDPCLNAAYIYLKHLLVISKYQDH